MTTEKFLLEFEFESLRDLPDLEALRDAGLMSADAGAGDGDGEKEQVTDKGIVQLSCHSLRVP